MNNTPNIRIILARSAFEMGWTDDVKIVHLVGFLQDLFDHPGLTPGQLIPEMFQEYLDTVAREEQGSSELGE